MNPKPNDSDVASVNSEDDSEQNETHAFRFGFSTEWVSMIRTGTRRYTFWIRSGSDPKRRTPGAQGLYGVDPHNKLNSMSLEELRRLAWRCLSAHPGLPMTFNALSVRLFDLTADVTGDTTFEDAVWSLLIDGCVSITMEAPILMLRTCDLTELTHPAPMYQERLPPQLSLF